MTKISFRGLFCAPLALNLAGTTLCAQPIILAPLVNQAVPAGFTATLGVFSSGAIGYKWYFNGQLIPAATNYLLNIIDQSTNQGQYSVVLTNASTSGPVDSDRDERCHQSAQRPIQHARIV